MDTAGQVTLVELPPPSDGEVLAICARAGGRILALCDADDGAEPTDDDGLGGATALFLPGRFAEPSEPPKTKRKTAAIDGFSLHADSAVAADDRAGLEHLLRYGARPPFAHRRFALTASGKVAYRLRRPFYTGQTEVVLAPTELLRRLSLLIPPPRQHQLRFHGSFAPGARCRRALATLLPATSSTSSDSLSGCHAKAEGRGENVVAESPGPSFAARLSWAQLFARVFERDVKVCPACGGPTRVLAVITDEPAKATILSHLGLPHEPPCIVGARAPPEPELLFDGQSEPASGDPTDVA